MNKKQKTKEIIRGSLAVIVSFSIIFSLAGGSVFAATRLRPRTEQSTETERKGGKIGTTQSEALVQGTATLGPAQAQAITQTTGPNLIGNPSLESTDINGKPTG